MACRRRHGITRATTFKEETHHQPRLDDPSLFHSRSFSPSHPSLAANNIRPFDHPPPQTFNAYEDASKHESRGFWGILAQKAKAILEDDVSTTNASTSPQSNQPHQANQGFNRLDNPTLRKSLDKLTSSINHIEDSFEKALEEGRTIVENKTADTIQESRKLQTRSKETGAEVDNQTQQNQTNHETQLKASRDVAMATAAKAKLLLRELKTVKADLAFAKERCSQLEEENRRFRESREKGRNATDDDLIRLQLETLLAEKARLAHENSIYARENRFLREIVEYHQLTMQDVVYIDEGIDEVAEVNPSISRTLSITPPSPLSPRSPSEPPQLASAPFITKEIYPVSHQHLQQEAKDVVTGNDKTPSSEVFATAKNDVKRPSQSSA